MNETYTPEGQPVVGEGETCPYWELGDPPAVVVTRECWFCRWSDFRENIDIHKSESVCRNPANNREERKKA